MNRSRFRIKKGDVLRFRSSTQKLLYTPSESNVFVPVNKITPDDVLLVVDESLARNVGYVGSSDRVLVFSASHCVVGHVYILSDDEFEVVS